MSLLLALACASSVSTEVVPSCYVEPLECASDGYAYWTLPEPPPLSVSAREVSDEWVGWLAVGTSGPDGDVPLRCTGEGDVSVYYCVETE